MRRLVSREPAEAFELASYGVLAAWGTACGAGTDGDGAECRQRLRLVRDIGEALPSPEGAALIAAAAQAENAPGTSREALARGYVALAEGVRRSERRESEAARRAFAIAANLLRGAGSALLPWADYGQAATFVHGGDFEQVRSALAATAAPGSDRRLQASRARTLGTAEFLAGRESAACPRRRAAPRRRAPELVQRTSIPCACATRSRAISVRDAGRRLGSQSEFSWRWARPRPAARRYCGAKGLAGQLGRLGSTGDRPRDPHQASRRRVLLHAQP